MGFWGGGIHRNFVGRRDIQDVHLVEKFVGCSSASGTHDTFFGQRSIRMWDFLLAVEYTTRSLGGGIYGMFVG